MINYFTASLDETGIANTITAEEKERFIRSSTVNIFSGGGDDEIKELLISLLRDNAADGDVFKGRAIEFLAALLKLLVWRRDNEPDFEFSLRTIQSYTTLDKTWELIQLGRSGVFTDEAYKALEHYYQTVPGYTRQEEGTHTEKMSEQHNYIAFQLAGGFSLLLNTYKHLFDIDAGAVDFRDVFLRKRILYVMLPVMEKSVDTVQLLAKLIISGVKTAASQALGSQLQGHAKAIYRSSPANSNIPFLLLVDEGKFVLTKGFSVLPTQLRSLGFSIWFTALSYAGLKDNGLQFEAAEMIANTNVKVFLRSDPDKETKQLILDRGNTALVSDIMGFNVNNKGMMDKLTPDTRYAVSRINRIDIQDIMNQKPGQVHVLYRDKLIRGRALYIPTHESDNENDATGWHFLNITLPIIVDKQQLKSKVTTTKTSPSFKRTQLSLSKDDAKKALRWLEDVRQFIDGHSDLSIWDSITQFYDRRKKMVPPLSNTLTSPTTIAVKPVNTVVVPNSDEVENNTEEQTAILFLLVEKIKGKDFANNTNHEQKLNALCYQISDGNLKADEQVQVRHNISLLLSPERFRRNVKQILLNG